MKKPTLFYPLAIAVILLSAQHISAQTTSIPDPKFEQELINLGIDSDGVINGQIATADAEAITELVIAPQPEVYPDDYINNITGIEAFINLEKLVIGSTLIESLNVSTMPGLKYLDCNGNMLTQLDVSANPLLEYLYISSGGDVYPFNSFTEIDLSNNPNIKYLYADGGLNYINLKNGNNNPDMQIIVGYPFPVEGTLSVCIEIDDEDVAQAGQYPYSEWNVYGYSMTYSYTESCTMGVKTNTKLHAELYPNPATDVLHISLGNTAADNVKLLDVSGRLVREFSNPQDNTINVSGLDKGVYMVVIASGNSAVTKKVVVE